MSDSCPALPSCLELILTSSETVAIEALISNSLQASTLEKDLRPLYTNMIPHTAKSCLMNYPGP